MSYHQLFKDLRNEFKDDDSISAKGTDYLIAKYEDAFDHYFESGMSLTNYSTPMASFLNWNHSNWLYWAISSAIRAYMICPEKQGYLIDNIVASKKSRGFESYFFASACKTEGSNALLRDKNGELFSEIFFKKIQSKSNISWMLNSIFANDDVEALNLLLTIPYYRKCLEGEELKRVLNGIEMKPESNAYKILMNEAPGSSLDNYLNILLSMNRSQDNAFAEKVYQKQYSRDYGHVLLDYAMRQWHIHESPGQLWIANKMVEDGADWFMAYKQASVSPSIYLDLKDRQANPLEELRMMISEWDNTPTIKRNKVVLKSIVMGMSGELINEAKADPIVGKTVKRIVDKERLSIEPSLD